MVIVHKNNLAGCPTGGWDAPTKPIDVITEYVPREKLFRIMLPEHMHERLNGKTFVTGRTADECLDAMRTSWNKYRDTFMEAREIRKFICFDHDIRAGECQGIFSQKIRIKLSWHIAYLCQLNSDKPDEEGWIQCTETGMIRSNRDIKNRINPNKASHSGDNYLDWTPEREEFFTQMIDEFNRLKLRMMDFFDPIHRDEMVTKIESASGTLLIPEQTLGGVDKQY